MQKGVGGPEVLGVAQIPRPEPGPDEVLIKVAAAGVNRADLLQRRGLYPPPQGASQILGLEVSGQIAGLGADVKGWEALQPVVALLAGGGYAEYVAVPAGQCVPPPEGYDLVDAAGLIEVAATVLSNFDLVGLAAGETVLVHGGAGGIGSFALPYGKALGCQVYTTVGNALKAKVARSLGADLAVDYHGDWAAAIGQVTGGRGVDVILDIIGAKYLQANVNLLATGGRLVVIGLQGGNRGQLDLNRLLTKQATVLATSLRGKTAQVKAGIVQQVAQRVWPLITSGTIRLPGASRFALEDVAAAHRQIESGDNVGKIVLTL
ncbi:MAG: NAD(P)H-quinone oxidoreductase [Micrococcales bacterium]|nr:NAD(P)H-quinone oxidoreductase [Micrococcales bacterium]